MSLLFIFQVQHCVQTVVSERSLTTLTAASLGVVISLLLIPSAVTLSPENRGACYSTSPDWFLSTSKGKRSRKPTV